MSADPIAVPPRRNVARTWVAALNPRWRQVLGALLGAAAGATYALLIGCRTGTCPITSNAWVAGLFGAVVVD